MVVPKLRCCICADVITRLSRSVLMTGDGAPDEERFGEYTPLPPVEPKEARALMIVWGRLGVKLLMYAHKMIFHHLYKRTERFNFGGGIITIHDCSRKI